MEHVLERDQVLEVSSGEAWDFFSNPRNLASITPPWMGFRVVSIEGERMHEGQRIELSVRVAPLIRMRWTTEIREVDEGRSFVDVQTRGPYRLWHHRHSFEPEGEGVRMSDEVRYAIGFGPIGELAHRLFVRRQLERIFDHRAQVLEEKFGSGEDGDDE